ncbi:ferrochelatase [Vineibacter terrae]|uniref:Ferrochelatase n=1 Tax=Vineibacter terrae TaxID=2586908 RepID=A0A5C8PPG0_9HYPH|nr:ferrochelatase [Vineibacter terrae]TXL75910.1 ferrochelatase [Vineibacter terrae]
MSRVAVVLFNLGGPDSPEAVEPFLRNLFADPAILRVPGFVRRFLGPFIARRRAPTAQAIYARIGGRSPILPQTQAQAAALDAALADRSPDHSCRAFIAMRYWHPFSAQTAAAVKAYGPDRVVLLPLYPQMSTTTSQSSIDDWRQAAQSVGLDAPTRIVCCYPVQSGLIEAAAALIRPQIDAVAGGKVRLLFSAHGLPEKVIRGGDPYQWQVECTARAIVERLGSAGLDWAVCYQSRVGPLKWIGPSTDDEIRRAGGDGKAVVLFPVAFVSEHSETLVELDIEYRELAHRSGVPAYHRVATVGVQPAFIDGLAELVLRTLAEPAQAVCNDGSMPACDSRFPTCLMRAS